jgi:hypothetical protein
MLGGRGTLRTAGRASRVCGRDDAKYRPDAGARDARAQPRRSAGSVLQSIGGETVIATLRAFVRQAETDMAREEAQKVLAKLDEGSA